ncbi:MAG: hypothetical protein SGARI_000127 [Bacillariaceae sp.]
MDGPLQPKSFPRGGGSRGLLETAGRELGDGFTSDPEALLALRDIVCLCLGAGMGSGDMFLGYQVTGTEDDMTCTCLTGCAETGIVTSGPSGRGPGGPTEFIIGELYGFFEEFCEVYVCPFNPEIPSGTPCLASAGVESNATASSSTFDMPEDWATYVELVSETAANNEAAAGVVP